jgi:poly-gamma-glutamate capsule biosynthesis protein CapA/YwtB (metallophosphatase superfamily)
MPTHFLRRRLVAALVCALAVVGPSTRGQEGVRLSGIAGSFRLAAVGDALVTMRFSQVTEPRFLDVIKLIRESDVGFANLEMLFHDFRGSPAAERGGTWMGADPVIAEDLKWAGFKLFGRANNHTGDYGEYGMQQTTDTLSRLGLTQAGVGRTLGDARSPAYYDGPKGRVALISCASTFTPSSRAGASRADLPGRPGLSPLRHTQLYKIDAKGLADLTDLAAQLRLPKPSPNANGGFNFLGTRYQVAQKPGIEWTADERDVRDILASVRDARRMADFVVVSIHSHEPSNNSTDPAPFLPTFARAAIDAGADVFVGHGPHRLRGVEIYKGKPIFYSLGDFFFQNDAVRRLPADFYEEYGLAPESTPADAYDARDASAGAFSKTQANFESAVAVSEYQDGKLTSVTLHPVTLGQHEPRGHRGRPMTASPDDARRIIDEVTKISAQYGTRIEFRGGVGVVMVGAPSTSSSAR